MRVFSFVSQSRFLTVLHLLKAKCKLSINSHKLWTWNMSPCRKEAKNSSVNCIHNLPGCYLHFKILTFDNCVDKNPKTLSWIASVTEFGRGQNASLWRWSGHGRLRGDLRADAGHSAVVITSPSWPECCGGILQKEKCVKNALCAAALTFLQNNEWINEW